MKRFLNIMSSLLRFWPHIIVYKRCDDKSTIDYEIQKWLESHHLPVKSGIRGLLNLLVAYPEFRSLFYFRTGKCWLSIFAKGQTNLEFYTESKNIGRGLIIWHGYSTVINCDKMGEDCHIWQNVVIGKSSLEKIHDRPTIGNNVLITAGSIAVGHIQIGDNVTIGAGTVVVKDVPSNTVVVNQPCRYIQK